MKTNFLIIFLLLSQSNFSRGNWDTFQRPTSSILYQKKLELFQLNKNEKSGECILKGSIHSVSNNFVNTTKTPLTTIINPFNVCVLLLFILFYIVFVCIIKLVQRHYMELE